MPSIFRRSHISTVFHVKYVPDGTKYIEISST